MLGSQEFHHSDLKKAEKWTYDQKHLQFSTLTLCLTIGKWGGTCTVIMMRLKCVAHQFNKFFLNNRLKTNRLKKIFHGNILFFKVKHSSLIVEVQLGPLRQWLLKLGPRSPGAAPVWEPSQKNQKKIIKKKYTSVLDTFAVLDLKKC